MTDLKHQNLSFYRSTFFIRELYQRGVRHLVISPGSRSTPLTMAAAAHPGVKKHVILDERSAAFTALGIGKTTGIPAVLICTSGTAAANYYPAVIEAYQSGVPLIVATADRPPELRNTDANQTINQIELFGKFVLSFEEIHEPFDEDPKLNNLIELTGRVFEQSVIEKGPVHLNFSFSKPLEPEIEFVETIAKENEKLSAKTDTHIIEDQVSAGKTGTDIYPILENTDRPLIIIGQLPSKVDIEPIFKLAEALKCPVLSEQGAVESNYSIQGFEGFLRNREIAEELNPDLILRFGLQPASKSMLMALESWKPNHHIYVTHPSNKKKTSLPVTDTLKWNGGEFSANHLKSGGQDYWIKQWKEASKKYFEFKRRTLSDLNILTDGNVYEEFSRQIPEKWWVFFSNSFPARDHSMFGQWKAHSVYTNRGASGIDGITSTNIGIALGCEEPGILFTGDLAFLHDSNALLNSSLLNTNLVIVILNNKGGSIFRMLPIAKNEKYFNKYFETPQHVDISQLCFSHRLNYQEINSIEQLKKFDLSDFLNNTEKSLHVIECNTDPDASMKLRKKLWMQ